jgi:hypothetical protein
MVIYIYMGLIKYLRKICYCCFKDNNKISDSDLERILDIWNEHCKYDKLEDVNKNRDEQYLFYPTNFNSNRDDYIR